MVTGGLGFVGHAVTRALLEAGHDPVVVTSRSDAEPLVGGVPVVCADLCDPQQVVQAVHEVVPEAVCHLAGLTRVRDSFKHPVRYFEVNVGGTIALLQALAPVGQVPVVFASTGAVYGPGEGQIAETHPTAPSNPYGATKVAAEQLLAYHAATGALGVVVLRCFNIAGAVEGVGDSDRTRIIPKALAVAAGQADRLGINGDGKAVREFTHVADVATAAVVGLEAATPGEASLFNVGSGVESTMLDVVDAVERVTGRDVPTEHLRAKNEPAVLMADSTRIRDQLGWRPQHSGLDKIVRDAWAAITQ